MIKTIHISRFGLIQLSLLILFVISSLSIPVSSPAKVTGTCSNCHTMHNSQNGTEVARTGAGVGWDGTGLTGGTTAGPQKQLLITTCVGCHSSTTSSTIINLGTSKIPIVFNTIPPVNPLAGGNFYWVSNPSFGSAYGHNVYGIANTDSNLTQAPGRIDPTCDTNTCHQTLAAPPNMDNSFKGGCQGCHTEVSHHDDTKPWYRFLKGHSTNRYVTGIEDSNWEQNPASGHNKYQGYDGPVDSGFLSDTHSMSSFCGGCHGAFHRKSYIGGGTTSPWTRHPTDIKLYNKGGEYTGYDTVNSYSAEAPVAWTNPASPSLDTAVVMCLSCHRPHGSDQPDLLRWDYNAMLAGTQGAGKGKGCFTCHTTKDGD